MFQKVIFCLLFLFIPLNRAAVNTVANSPFTSSEPVSELAAGEQLFEEMELGGTVNFIAFRQAVAGYNRIKEKSKTDSDTDRLLQTFYRETLLCV